jgi:hypothetical protein
VAVDILEMLCWREIEKLSWANRAKKNEAKSQERKKHPTYDKTKGGYMDWLC